MASKIWGEGKFFTMFFSWGMSQGFRKTKFFPMKVERSGAVNSKSVNNPFLGIYIGFIGKLLFWQFFLFLTLLKSFSGKTVIEKVVQFDKLDLLKKIFRPTMFIFDVWRHFWPKKTSFLRFLAKTSRLHPFEVVFRLNCRRKSCSLSFYYFDVFFFLSYPYEYLSSNFSRSW